MSSLLPLLLLPVLWFGMILPQRKRARAQQELISNLAPGDDVITTSGIYGSLREIDGDIAHLEIAPGITIRIARRAIAQTVHTPDALTAGSTETTSTTTASTTTASPTSEAGV
jgi:preprotein translocase subunit YajC